MRISSHQLQQNAINSMLEQQAKLTRTQQQVATGKKIFKPSEDPVAAAKVVNLKDTLAGIEQHQVNIGAARARINIAEGVLSSSVDAIHRLRELAVQANNDSQNESTRYFISEEVEQLLDELLNLANTTDSNNEFLFAGSLTRVKPFSHNDTGGFDYNGDESHREIQISRTRQIAVDDSGADIFLAIREGNGTFATFSGAENKGSGVIDPGRATGFFVPDTYAIVFDQQYPGFAIPEEAGRVPLTYSVVDSKGNILVGGEPFEEGKEIIFNGVHTSIKGIPEHGDYFVIRPSQNKGLFSTVQDFVNILRAKTPEENDKVAFHNKMNQVLANLSQSLDNILGVRGTIGARLNALDSQEAINDAYKLQIREILSDVEDLDYAEAVSKLNLQLTGLEASQKAFTKVQNLSLFNYF